MGMIDYNFTKLGDFNDVISYYKRQLELIKQIKPMQRFDFPVDMGNESFYYDRAILNNLGISVAQNFDYIERNLPENIDELILSELIFNNEPCENESAKQSVKKFELAYRTIMQDNGLTAFETLKQIRNALLHGNYFLNFKSDASKDKFIVKQYGTNDDGPCQVVLEGEKLVYLKSTKMVGVLPYAEMTAIFDYLVYNIRSRCSLGNREFTISDNRFKSCKNEIFLRNFIDSLQSYYIIPNGINENGNKEQIIGKFPFLKATLDAMQRIDGTNCFLLRRFSEDEMIKRRQDVENYIRYVGKNYWQYFYFDGINEDLYDNIFQSKYNGTVSLSNAFCRIIDSVSHKQRDGIKWDSADYKEIIKVGFEEPIIYADMLLGLLNYTGSYLKANSADENSLFEYHNLQGFEGVKVLIDDTKTKSIQYGVSGEVKQRKLDSSIENCKHQLKKINKEIHRTNKQIANLNDKNPNREKLELQLRRTIEEKEDEKKEVINRIFKLSVRKEEYNHDYTDYSELFRHLRNSIAHGMYEIEYDRALKNKDLNKIRFTFYDYNEENLERKNPDFKIILTASQVIRMVNGIQLRVNHQLNKENQIDKIVETRFEDVILEEISDGIELDEY